MQARSRRVAGAGASGYAVDLAGRGDEALLCARVYDYDAIVLDVLLPGGDGFAVCQTLREEGFWAPILMVTARDRVDDRIRGLARRLATAAGGEIEASPADNGGCFEIRLPGG